MISYFVGVPYAICRAPTRPVASSGFSLGHGRSYRYQRLGSASHRPSACTELTESSTRIARAASSGTTAAGRITSVIMPSSYASSRPIGSWVTSPPVLRAFLILSACRRLIFSRRSMEYEK